MPRPAKKPPNRANGLWEVKRSFYKIAGDKKQKVVNKQKTVCVCQSCGHNRTV